MAEYDRRGVSEEFSEWEAAIRNGYFRAFMYHALLETGALQQLKGAEHGRTSAEIAEACNLHPGILEQVMSYLAFADTTLEKRGNRFYLGKHGDWPFEPRVRSFGITWVTAYGSCLHELLPALRQQKQYGRDFARDDRATALGTWEGTSQFDTPVIADHILKLQPKIVAELACGTAPQSRILCQRDAALTAVCADNSADALEAARELALQNGVADRMQFLLSDLTRLDEWLSRPEVQDVDVFIVQGALHELLRDGEAFVVDLLQSFKRHHAGKHLVVTELRSLSEEELRAGPTYKKIRQLTRQFVMHGPLTDQGVPLDVAGWKRLFERAGFELTEFLALNRDTYVLRILP